MPGRKDFTGRARRLLFGSQSLSFSQDARILLRFGSERVLGFDGLVTSDCLVKTGLWIGKSAQTVSFALVGSEQEYGPVF